MVCGFFVWWMPSVSVRMRDHAWLPCPRCQSPCDVSPLPNTAYTAIALTTIATLHSLSQPGYIIGTCLV